MRDGESDADADGYRSPELRAEIARGKLPVGYDPAEAAYRRLHELYVSHRGPFGIGRYRPGVPGGSRGDFMVRLCSLKRGLAQGDGGAAEGASRAGIDGSDVDLAMSHWRSAHLAQRARAAASPGGVTIREV